MTLLAPQNDLTDEYNSFMASSRNLEAERMLDQPSEKRSSVRKDVFIKGRQETLQDVISFIANIVTFAKFWVKLDESEDGNPFVIQQIVELADYLSSADYLYFNESHKKSTPYMAHNLVVYIFNIFSVYIKMAKNPNVVRKFKITNKIDIIDVKVARIIHHQLMEQLQLCTATSSLQNIFGLPSSSYKIFFPSTTPKINSLVQTDKKRPSEDKEKSDNPTKKKKLGLGSIVNTTGKRLFFPKGLEKKYCADFLDINEVCKHGENCNFVHAIFPSGFSDKDKEIMTKHVNETECLAFKNVS